MSRVAVITGGSSGIGHATAQLFAENGWTVYELSRSGADGGNVRHISADITDEAQIKAAFAQVFEEQKRLDLLVNNAGMGISGAVEYTETADARRIFDVNFFGGFLCCREALPYLRQTPNAQIICISSVAALFAIPYQAFYSATKSAVNSFTLALSSELRPFNIRVNAVMPGDVRTGFTAARVKNEAGAAVYGKTIDNAVGVMEKDEQTGMSPSAVAAKVLAVAKGKSTGKIYTVGAKYKAFVALGKILPTSLANRIVAAMYK